MKNKKNEGELKVKLNERGGIFYSMLENSPEGIVLLQEGVIKFFNRAILELTGYNSEELNDKKFEHFVHPEDRKMTLKRYKARIAGDEVSPLHEIRIVGKDGSIIPVEINTALISYGNKKAIVSFIRNITMCKQAEAKLLESKKIFEVIFNHRFQLTG